MPDPQDDLKALTDYINQRSSASQDDAYTREVLRRKGMTRERGLLGTMMKTLSVPIEATFAAGRSAVSGRPFAEEYGPFMEETGQSPVERTALQAFPPKPSDTLLSSIGKGIGRTAISFADPLFLLGAPLALSREGQAAMKATPELLRGAKALPLTEQIRAGYRSGILNLRIPGGQPRPPGIGQAVDQVRATLYGNLAKIPKVTGELPIVKPVRDWVLDNFTRYGHSPEIAEIRGDQEAMHAAVLRRVLDQGDDIGAMEHLGELIADDLTKKTGKSWTKTDVFAHALEWWENGFRNPERFTDTPQVIKDLGRQYADRLSILFEREAAAGVPGMHKLTESPEALAKAREAGAVKAVTGKLGLFRKEGEAGREALTAPSATMPEFFEVVPHATDTASVERAKAEASALSAEIVKQVDQTILEPRYVTNQITPYGKRFYGLAPDDLTELERSGVIPKEWRGRKLKAADRYMKQRSFLRPDLTRLSIAEKEALAKEGQLPGYETMKAKQPLYEVRPTTVLMPRIWEGETAAEQARVTLNAARKFGMKVTNDKGKIIPEAIAAAEQKGNMEPGTLRVFRHPTTGNVEWWLPKDLRKHIESTIAITNPRSTMAKAWTGMLSRVMQLINTWTVVPFPSTIERNIAGDAFFSAMNGTRTSHYGYVIGSVLGDFRPLRKAMENAWDADKFAEGMQAASRFRAELHGDSFKMTPPAELEDDLGFTTHFDGPNGERIPGRVTPTEIAREILSGGVATGGWDADSINRSLGHFVNQTRSESGLLRLVKGAFGGSQWSPLSPGFIGLWPFRKLQRFADDLPRMAEYVRWRQSGLTESEALFETTRNHASIAGLTPLEKTLRLYGLPFYRWLRFNIPKSLTLIATRPHVAYAVHKLAKAATLGIPDLEETDVPKWAQDNYPFGKTTMKDGKLWVDYGDPWGALPLGDVKSLLDPETSNELFQFQAGPFIKAGYELLTNKEWLTGREIPEQDQLFGQTTSGKVAAVARSLRPLKYLDSLFFPKSSQSSEEQAKRQHLTLMNYLLPLGLQGAKEGTGPIYEEARLAGLASALKDATYRTLRPTGRFRDSSGRLTPAGEQVLKEANETFADLKKQAGAIKRQTKPLNPEKINIP